MRSLIILALIVLVPVGVYYYFTLSFQNSNSEEVLAKSSVETNTQPSLEEVSTTSDKINEIDNITPELVNEASGTETSNRITVVDGSEEVVDSIVPSVTTASTATPINNKKEIAKRVLSGEISLDDLEKMDTDLEMSDFVEVLEFRKTPVPLKAGTAVKSTSEHVKGMGINIETGDDSILSLYAYGVNNDYTGHILIPQEDGTRFGFKVENIPATSIGGLGGDVSISVMPNKGSVTIFMVGEQAKIANLRHWVMNDLDNMVQLSFPVSSRTRGSVTIERTDTGLIINKWNFDFDDNGVTDVSIGNQTGFTITDYEIAFDTIANDKLLQIEDRELIASWEKPFIAMIKEEQAQH